MKELEVVKMSERNEKNKAMTVAHLQQILAVIAKEVGSDFEIWLSSDEEGNEFLPMLKNEQLSLDIDKEQKRITFYPAHR
jgi:septum formation topological specificity factor MinE